MTRPAAWALAALLLTLLGLGACRQPPTSAPGDPVAAVRAQAQALRDNDLVRYSRLSLPPDLHARVAQRWSERLRLAAPPSAEDRKEFGQMMTRFTEPEAETKLYRRFDARLGRVEGEIAGQWVMMQATATIFLTAAVKANDSLSPAEKDHAGEVISALMAWAQPALFTDRKRARAAIAELVRSARALELETLEQARALEMEPALAKGGIALAGLKRLLAIYSVDLDAILDQTQASVVEAEGDRARVRISYPLFDKRVSFELPMLRRDGGWYSEAAIREAEADLAEPLLPAPEPESAPSVEPAPEAAPSDSAPAVEAAADAAAVG